MLGVWVILLGFRVIGKKAGADEDWDKWWKSWGRYIRVLGMVMLTTAAIRVAMGIE